MRIFARGRQKRREKGLCFFSAAADEPPSGTSLAATRDRWLFDCGNRRRNFLVRHREAKGRQITSSHGPVSVLVGDFANHTGDPVLDNTLEQMLGVALEGASFINVYSRGDARKQAQKLPHPTEKLDEQSARLIAVNQDVNTVITGEISLARRPVRDFGDCAGCRERQGNRKIGSHRYRTSRTS